MTGEWWQAAGGFIIGIAAGALYFGGLWLTVRRIGLTRKPERRLLFSFVARMGLLLMVFYALTRWGWPAMAAAMLGLLIARQLWLATKGRPRPTAGG